MRKIKKRFENTVFLIKYADFCTHIDYIIPARKIQPLQTHKRWAGTELIGLPILILGTCFETETLNKTE